ncbi:hypothetical protein CYMTET_27329 [Cymbomonas tetramitiformis]|uniref:Uncharacterized protein n=1 Tax=Cymbomonas tetramitiformis TaxID=36881 RepID=A0AAE0KXC3_9CHLO|nr:hypothetical protein CYMTET_27329 [Cymbomonas tetramitiformis]
MSGPSTRSKRSKQLFKQSQIDKVVRLPNSVRDSPTPQTPPVPTPTPAADNDPVSLVAARTRFIEQSERARDVLKEARHRKWAKAVSKYALGGESVRFWAEDDAGKLAKIITALKNDFEANGLDLGVFDLSRTDRGGDASGEQDVREKMRVIPVAPMDVMSALCAPPSGGGEPKRGNAPMHFGFAVVKLGQVYFHTETTFYPQKQLKCVGILPEGAHKEDGPAGSSRSFFDVIQEAHAAGGDEIGA